MDNSEIYVCLVRNLVSKILLMSRPTLQLQSAGMSANILSLEALALNILKNSFSEKIAESVDVPELDPCSLCNQELFLYELGYIFWGLCPFVTD